MSIFNTVPTIVINRLTRMLCKKVGVENMYLYASSVNEAGIRRNFDWIAAVSSEKE
jgi:hypothetical protein